MEYGFNRGAHLIDDLSHVIGALQIADDIDFASLENVTTSGQKEIFAPVRKILTRLNEKYGKAT